MIINNCIDSDLHLLHLYLPIAAGYLICLYMIVICHELGHLIYLHSKGIKAKINWGLLVFSVGTQADYERLTEQEYKNVNLWGLMAGLLPIAAGYLQFPPFGYMVIPYLVGARQDIMQVFKDVKLEE